MREEKHLNQFDSLFKPLDKKEVSRRKFGQITSGIKSQTSILSIINFVSKQLPIWRDDPDRIDEQSERKLNSQLYKFLNSQANENFPMFCFGHEEPQYTNRDVDISVLPDKSMIIEAQVYTIYDPVLVIDCKWLPAPPPKEREKEYVTGNKPNKISGGIQRFKLGLHGAKHNLAVMIGYLQSHTNRYWYAKINSWIIELVKYPIGDGCTWTDDEILKAFKGDTTNGIYRYHSIHSRTGEIVNNKIELHHLWIVMNNNK